MKNRRVVLLILFAAVLMVGCSSSEIVSESPEAYFEFNPETGYIKKFHPNGLKGDLPNLEYVVVPETIQGKTVLGIGHMAFNSAKDVKGVELSSRIEVIDTYAFYGAEQMVTVTMPDSVVEIGDSAFMACSQLNSIKFSESLKVIGKDAFKGCDAFRVIELPDALEDIGAYAFAFLSHVEYIDLGEGVKTIQEGAFYGTGGLVLRGTSLTFPESLTRVESEAFAGMMLVDVTNYSKEIQIADSENETLLKSLIDQIHNLEDPRGYYYLTEQSNEWVWAYTGLDAYHAPVNLSQIMVLLLGGLSIIRGIWLMLGKRKMIRPGHFLWLYGLLIIFVIIQMGFDPKGTFYINLTGKDYGILIAFIGLILVYVQNRFKHVYHLIKWDMDSVLSRVEQYLTVEKIGFKRRDMDLNGLKKLILEDNSEISVEKKIGETHLNLGKIENQERYVAIKNLFRSPISGGKRITFVSTGVTHIIIGFLILYFFGTI